MASNSQGASAEGTLNRPTDGELEQLLVGLPKSVRGNLSFDDEGFRAQFALIALMSPQRTLVEKLHRYLYHAFSGDKGYEHQVDYFNLIRTKLTGGFVGVVPAVPYRLPEVVGEFPVHLAAINKHIRAFNTKIKSHYVRDANGNLGTLDRDALAKEFDNVLKAISEHGEDCDPLAMRHLVMALAGWAKPELRDGLLADSRLAVDVDPVVKPRGDDAQPRGDEAQPEGETTKPSLPQLQPVTGVVAAADNISNPTKAFEPSHAYQVNRAGLLASTTAITCHMFETKPGGHTDATTKVVPELMSKDEFCDLALLRLSHRLGAEFTQPELAVVSQVILGTLGDLGVEMDGDIIKPYTLQSLGNLDKDSVIEQIDKVMDAKSRRFRDKEKLQQLKNVLGDYVFELIQGFQINPAAALGIGANRDGTVSMSNASGTYAYRFLGQFSGWASRFDEMSRLRQGPAEATMNAGRGVGIEAKTLLLGQEYMAKLQPQEYENFLYSALIDNMLADLYPDPSYFENVAYQKYRMAHRVTTDEQGKHVVVSYRERSAQGTFFERGEQLRQVPMFREFGSHHVTAFATDAASTDGGSSRASSMVNPNAAMQMQHAASAQASRRGDVVYNPIGDDWFIEDPQQGQTVRYRDGTTLVFNGVMPKNFDRRFSQEYIEKAMEKRAKAILKREEQWRIPGRISYLIRFSDDPEMQRLRAIKEKISLGLDTELCASFVMRMVHSSNIHCFCPTFRAVSDNLKAQLLPQADTFRAKMQSYYSGPSSAKDEFGALCTELEKPERGFSSCQSALLQLFKAETYRLYRYQVGGSSYLAFTSIQDELCGAETMSCAQYHQVLRELKANAPPVPEKNKAYLDAVERLGKLIENYFPTPSDDLSEQINIAVNAQVPHLLTNPRVLEYFRDLKETQAGIAKTITPGTLFTELEHGGVSQDITGDANRSHNEKASSSYRGPRGEKMAEREGFDSNLDGMAKGVGATIQTFQVYKPLSGVTRILAHPFAQASSFYHEYPENNLLLRLGWGFCGFIKGIIWDGVLVPAGHYLSLIPEFFRRTWNKLTEDDKEEPSKLSPANISSAPENTPGSSEAVIDFSRDLLAELDLRRLASYCKHVLFRQQQSSDSIDDEEKAQLLLKLYLEQIKKHTTSAIKIYLHDTGMKSKADLSHAELEQLIVDAYHQQIDGDTALSAQAQAVLLGMDKLTDEVSKAGGDELRALLAPQSSQMTEPLLAAISSLLLDKSLRDQPRKLNAQLEKIKEEWHLKPHQYELVRNVYLTFLRQLVACKTEDEQSAKHDAWIALFAHEGTFYQELQRRHRLSRMVEHHMTDVIVRNTETELSASAAAHEKWFAFVRQSREGLLFSDQELSQHMRAVASAIHQEKAPPHPIVADVEDRLLELEIIYRNQAKGAPSDEQLESIAEAQSRITSELSRTVAHQSGRLLHNLFDITCQRVVQHRLADVLKDRALFNASKKLRNPLSESAVLGHWLSDLYNDRKAFNEFMMKHQRRTSKSLDESMFRYQCIFKAIEQWRANNPDDARKAGVVALNTSTAEPLVAMWLQANDNRDSRGVALTDEGLTQQVGYHCEESRVDMTETCAVLVDGSATMRETVKKMQQMLPAEHLEKKLPQRESPDSSQDKPKAGRSSVSR